MSSLTSSSYHPSAYGDGYSNHYNNGSSSSSATSPHGFGVSAGTPFYNPVTRLSPEDIINILADSYRYRFAVDFAYRISNLADQSGEILERRSDVSHALKNMLDRHENRNIETYFAAVQRDFIGYLGRSGTAITPQSQRSLTQELQAAHNVAKGYSSKPAERASVISTAKNLIRLLRNTCVNLKLAITARLGKVMRVMQQSGESILSAAKNSMSRLRRVFVKLTTKTDILSLIENEQNRLTIARFPLMKLILSHSASRLDAINSLNEGNGKNVIIQSLADFLARENSDAEFMVDGYTSQNHVNRFLSSIRSPMRDQAKIGQALIAAFDAAKKQHLKS